MIRASYCCGSGKGQRRLARHVAGAALLLTVLAPAAQAGQTTIDFENVFNIVSPTLSAGDSIYAGRDQFSSNGYVATVADSPFAQSLPDYAPGLAGGIANGSNPFTCDIVACPAGNGSRYYVGLNDGSVSFARSDNLSFHVQALDYAFVAPVSGLADGQYGRLVISGKTDGGGSVSTEIDFAPQGGTGQYSFTSWSAAGFAKASLTSVTISACLFDGLGNCVNSDLSANQAQFAIDNLQLSTNVSPVPEPDAYAMLGLGLAVLGLARRHSKRSGRTQS